MMGPVNPSETFTVSVLVRRRPDAPPPPDVADLTKMPVGMRTHLTRAEFVARYGASKADLDAVEKFGLAHGLKVVESSGPQRTVIFSGTAKQMSEAFAVDLNRYETPEQTYRGLDGGVHVPAELADIVMGVFGLDNREIGRPALAKAEAVPAGVTGLTPPQVARLYDFPTSPTAAGQTIGIIEFAGGYKLTDVQAFFKGLGLPTPSITDVGVGGATNTPDSSNNTIENLLDIDVAGSVAPGARIVMYYAPNNEMGFMKILTTIQMDATNDPSVISISWTWGEPSWITSLSPLFQDLMTIGVTVFAASGDSGSGASPNAGVNYPASDPWVTGTGGTTVENVSGSTFSQTTWSGSGGGVSAIFPLPAYQVAAKVPPSVDPGHRVGRGVPDVAGNADPASGYPLILNGASAGNWGGTSAVAPLYAGLVALLNASLGERVGFLNTNLYAFAGPFVFRDITTGGNGAYNAGPGWDACTGYGSIDGNDLLTALRGVGLPVALSAFDGKLYMAWKGEERDERIFFSDFNGSTWTPQRQVPGVGTNSGVALAVFEGKLYMAWKGEEEDQGIYWSSFNGTSWAAQKEVPGVASSTGPRIAVFNNALYMAWKGEEGDPGIYWSSFNGTNWAAQKVVPGVGTSVGPALAVYKNALYAAWKGEFGDQRLFYSHFNGSTWAPQQLIPGNSSEGPSLAIFNNALYAAWKGEFGDQRLFYSHFNGSTWAPQQLIPGNSSVGPGLSVFNNALYAAWKGENGDERIFYSHFNGSTWSPQQQVSGVGTSPDELVHELVGASA